MDGIRKISSYVPVSAEMLAVDGGFLVPELFALSRRTPAQVAADKAAARERAEQIRTTAAVRHAHARNTVAPVLVEVLDHHGPVVSEHGWEPECEGCDATGAEVDPTPWPCTTWCLITGETA